MAPGGSNNSAPASSVPPTAGGLRVVAVDTRALTVIATLALSAAFIVGIRNLLVPILFAAVLVFLGEPVVVFLEKKKVPRAAGAGLFLLGAALLVLGLVAMVLPKLVLELRDLFLRLPDFFHKAEAWLLTRFGVELPNNLKELYAFFSDDFKAKISSFAASTGPTVGKEAIGMVTGALSAMGAVGRMVLIPLFAFFCLAELPALRAFFRPFVRQAWRPGLDEGLSRLNVAISNLLRGQVLVASAMALIYVVGLLIFGVPLALAIGILSGIAYLIPFASPVVCVILSVVFTLLEAKGWVPIAGAVGIAVAVQVVEGWVLTPRIVGGQAGLSPLATVAAVVIGGELFGFLGVLFALPVATALAVIVDWKGPREGDGPGPSGFEEASTGDSQK
jgi:predicted PurR-regulated permease PerM